MVARDTTRALQEHLETPPQHTHTHTHTRLINMQQCCFWHRFPWVTSLVRVYFYLSSLYDRLESYKQLYDQMLCLVFIRVCNKTHNSCPTPLHTSPQLSSTLQLPESILTGTNTENEPHSLKPEYLLWANPKTETIGLKIIRQWAFKGSNSQSH